MIGAVTQRLPMDQTSPSPPALPRILILHNRYRQPGGEDVVVAAQEKLLRERGHDVRVLLKDNREIDGYNIFRKAALFFKTADNVAAVVDVAKVIKEFQPHIAYVHNTLPLLSPSIYRPLNNAGIKIVQWLHNYRLVCAAGTLYRDGAPCRLCIDDGLHNAVKYRCWNKSKMASLAVTRMQERHRRARTWHTDVDLFVALNSFMSSLFAKSGVIPEQKIVIHPNFAEVPVDASYQSGAGKGFIFVGRVAAEKGIATLLRASAESPDSIFKILGEVGPAQRSTPNVHFHGHVSRRDVLNGIQLSRALIFPSEWQEPFGLSIVEAMALSKPVIAARTAGPAEIVVDNETGLLYEPGDAAQLRDCIKKLECNTEFAMRLGRSGRERYVKHYSPDAGYNSLRNIHQHLGLVHEQE
jgi:glycosyltransferase involved in cell wall biosynthesis